MQSQLESARSEGLTLKKERDGLREEVERNNGLVGGLLEVASLASRSLVLSRLAHAFKVGRGRRDQRVKSDGQRDVGDLLLRSSAVIVAKLLIAAYAGTLQLVENVHVLCNRRLHL